MPGHRSSLDEREPKRRLPGTAGRAGGRRSDGGAERTPIADAEECLVELPEERQPVAVLEPARRARDVQRRRPGPRRRLHLRARSARHAAPTAHRAPPPGGRRHAAATSRRAAPGTSARSWSERNGSFWNSDSSQRSRASARAVSASASVRLHEQLGGERRAEGVEPAWVRPAAASRRSGGRAGSRTAGRPASRRGRGRPRAAPRSRAGSRSPRRRSPPERPADPRRRRARRASSSTQ